MSVLLYHGDSINVLKTMEDNSIDSVVTDPPYGLSDHTPDAVLECLSCWISGKEYVHQKSGFMGRSWDAWVPGPEIWKEVFRVLKPGGHLLAFAGTRSMDLMSMAVRLSGFELRDAIGYAQDSGNAPLMVWAHGQGMPKGLDIGKAIDKQAGVERPVVGYDATRARPNRKNKAGAIGKLGGGEKISDRTDNGATITAAVTEDAKRFQGWSTQLKPAWEPIIIARKPLEGNAAENAVKYGTGGMNIDACRIPTDDVVDDPRLGGKGTWGTEKMAKNVYEGGYAGERVGSSALGRFPANVILDGSDEVEAAFASFGETKSGVAGKRTKPHQSNSMAGSLGMLGHQEVGYGDSGSVSRFFYHAKATEKDRDGSKHVSVKPVDLMRYLVKLVTPKGGIVLDPFAGSGTTGQAAVEEGFDAILIEREAEYIQDCEHRLVMYLEETIKI